MVFGKTRPRSSHAWLACRRSSSWCSRRNLSAWTAGATRRTWWRDVRRLSRLVTWSAASSRSTSVQRSPSSSPSRIPVVSATTYSASSRLLTRRVELREVRRLDLGEPESADVRVGVEPKELPVPLERSRATNSSTASRGTRQQRRERGLGAEPPAGSHQLGDVVIDVQVVEIPRGQAAVERRPEAFRCHGGVLGDVGRDRLGRGVLQAACFRSPSTGPEPGRWPVIPLRPRAPHPGWSR